MDEVIERLDTIIIILDEMDNAATPDLIEAIQLAKQIITKERIKKGNKQNRLKEQQLEKQKQKFNDDLVKFSAAFDDVFDQFLTQLFKTQNRRDDKRFKK